MVMYGTSVHQCFASLAAGLEASQSSCMLAHHCGMRRSLCKHECQAGRRAYFIATRSAKQKRCVVPTQQCKAITVLHVCADLNLSGNLVGDAPVRHLCGEMCLADRICHLTSLRLSRCGLSAHCAPALEEMLLSTRTLVQLDLSWSSFDTRGAR